MFFFSSLLLPLVPFLFQNSPLSTFISFSFLKSKFHIWDSMQYLSFWVWLILLNVMIHPFSYQWHNFVLLWLNKTPLSIYYIFFIHSSFGRYLWWFHILAIVNGDMINVGVQVSLLFGHLHSFSYTLRSDIAGPYDGSSCGLLKKLHTDFHGSTSNTHKNTFYKWLHF
jgi:hypothetical protein